MNLNTPRDCAMAAISWNGSNVIQCAGAHGFSEIYDNSGVNVGEVFATLDEQAGDWDESTYIAVSVYRTGSSLVLPPDAYPDGMLLVQVAPPGTYSGFNTGGKKLIRINGCALENDDGTYPRTLTRIPFVLMVQKSTAPGDLNP